MCMRFGFVCLYVCIYVFDVGRGEGGAGVVKTEDSALTWSYLALQRERQG